MHLLLKLMLLLMFSWPAWAAEKTEQVTQAVTPGVGVGDWVTAVLGLVFIVALIFVSAWFVKRFSGLAVSQNKQLRIVAALPLGPRERIALIQVGGKQVLVGITSQGISHLQSFDEPAIEVEESRPSEFSQRLQTLLSARVASEPGLPADKEHKQDA